MDRFDEVGVNTLLSHYAEEEKIKGAVTPPLFQNSLFVFETSEELLKAMMEKPGGPPHHYSRLSNPTLDVVEQKIAKLEGMEACKVIGSGMGAIGTAIINCVEQGSHLIVVDTCYGPVRTFCSTYLERFGVSVSYVDGANVADVADHIRPETKAIYLESPSSILFRMQDVSAITKIAREKGIVTIFDNTYNSPIHMNPAEFGVDIVCHSCTKYLGGHSDITGGAIVADRKRIDHIMMNEVNLLGNIMHPFSAWLMNRGMRTLKLRMKQHEETANFVANWLEARPEIETVHHVGLASNPQRHLVEKYLRGTGGLLSFEPKTQDPGKLRAFADQLEWFGRGISWGGFESLVVPLSIQPQDYSSPRHLVRLYCGLEEAADLIADLESAMPLLA